MHNNTGINTVQLTVQHFNITRNVLIYADIEPQELREILCSLFPTLHGKLHMNRTEVNTMDKFVVLDLISLYVILHYLILAKYEW